MTYSTSNTKPPAPRIPAIAAAAVLAVVLSACGHTRRPPDPAPNSDVFELLVHTVRTEDILDTTVDSLVQATFDSDITYFGRFAGTGELHTADRVVYSDSIRFRTRQPYRLDAFLSADTLYSRSNTLNTAVSSDPMLECIFRGPALQIVRADGGPDVSVEHFKTDCPGGIYRRLDLPRTLGMFLTGIPRGAARPNGRWTQVREAPSFSGIGYHAPLRVEYSVLDVEDETMTVRVACDTSVTGFTTRLRDGGELNVLSNRIQVLGTLRAWAGGIWHEGRIRISETITYVRPAAGTRVLTKSCEYELTLGKCAR